MDNPTQAEVDACRDEYGEAHDAQMAFAGECAWCGHYDDAVEAGYVDELTGNVYTASGELLEQHTF